MVLNEDQYQNRCIPKRQSKESITYSQPNRVLLISWRMVFAFATSSALMLVIPPGASASFDMTTTETSVCKLSRDVLLALSSKLLSAKCHVEFISKQCDARTGQAAYMRQSL